MVPWHARSVGEVFEAFGTSDQGLTEALVKERLAVHGPNVLPEKPPPPLAAVFISQFQSPLIYLLLAASGALFLLGEAADSAIIFAILIFNAVVGTIQEGRAAHTLRSLKTFVETSATVVRESTERIISDRDVAPGDIIVLQEGERISADARITLANTLKVDESSFTGESTPVHKVTEALADPEAPASEQRNMVFKGTFVLAGSGKAVVVATGSETVIGRIAEQVLLVDTETPLKANIRHLARAVIVVVATVVTLLFWIGLSLGNSFSTMFGVAVSLAVSIIPEGLPIVMTVVLATGVWRMGKRHVLVKKLQAIEALGQARMIAVDKTGTITKNEQVIRRVWTPNGLFEVGGEGYEPAGAVSIEDTIVSAANHEDLLALGRAAALLAAARTSYLEDEKRWRISGDPTEAALLVFAQKLGFHKDELVHELPLVAEIPFDYALRYHATVHKGAEGNVLTVGGAPEEVLALCTTTYEGGKSRPFSVHGRVDAEAAFAAFSHQGLRVIALATRTYHLASIRPEAVMSLTLLGLVGMKDALRAEVGEAMTRTKEAGIRVVMITGDHRLTAVAIAKEAGIYHAGDTVLTGDEIGPLSDVGLANALGGVSVFARVTPEHKLRIINAYRARGEIVAMTGDGVNDAPPLVAADLGVAMGKVGTEVAKEAADIVLLDDNFGSIVSAVEEGRSIYITIKKVVLYLFSTSAGEALMIIAALLAGYPLPLLAAQIIWLNFVTDGFLDVALAMEPKESNLLRGHFERPKKYLVDTMMLSRMALMALPMVAGTLYLFDRAYGSDIAYGSTMALTTLAVFQWFNAWNCRSTRASILHDIAGNKFLIGATAIVILLQFLAVYHPWLQVILHTVPLSLNDWLIIVPVAASIVVVEELRKLLHRHLFPLRA
ncbi:hypothetical protein A3E65_02170 [Candidatus Kaiserbacteria bacterium RIFCSPHIGHO2_12_FULL_56_13]|uniref:Cation-transporting P-type ATPase N-terminal domain-containing protein n=2 Tax=Candidatus Kaiseribacteriota TaxID=1752734 RepID=A0A1F6E524_9BACT|nr:MAG: hypothetical protein A3C95_01920 [Candidatus Kaiserbacteria bacterium RIFCSPHIGHO2_02_FULL_56_30]OGG72160.1 MAG: hypothetical protein A3E65_02170 [Candidatus Kaiserbacteria bacterium RIFCSPHIGHO2_12_FULL_56_13]